MHKTWVRTAERSTSTQAAEVTGIAGKGLGPASAWTTASRASEHPQASRVYTAMHVQTEEHSTGTCAAMACVNIGKHSTSPMQRLCAWRQGT